MFPHYKKLEVFQGIELIEFVFYDYNAIKLETINKPLSHRLKRKSTEIGKHFQLKENENTEH